MSPRTLASLHPAQRDDIADLQTRRPVPGPGLAQVDPFLFLNHHGPQVYPPGNRGLPFGPHPHRGFETVTFILDGCLEHHDTGGHRSVIGAGGVQWMTAGSGLIHAEVSPAAFKATGGALEILQLWVNLPGRLKMTAPAYSGVQAERIPVLPIGGGRGAFHLVAGEWDGRTGPIASLTGVWIGWAALPAGARATLPAPRGRSVLCYTVRGSAEVAGTPAPRWTLARLADDGDAVEVAATEDLVLLFGHADPIGEPVVARGPFVMTSEAEIADAVRDYQTGLFDGTGPLAEVGG